LYVIDHAIAIDLIFHSKKINETFNIGGFNEFKNIDLVKILCNEMDLALGNTKGYSLSLIKFIEDRKGHDLRYAIDASKINNQLRWKPSVDFEQGLKITIQWYLNNKNWLSNIADGSYMNLKKYKL
jgi:dTDP-glucose 4,6-dehydratase